MSTPRLAGILLAICVLGCDDTLTGPSATTELTVFDPEVVVFEAGVHVSAVVGFTNNDSLAVGFSPCDVVLQADRPEGWDTVAFVFCHGPGTVWVAPGSGTIHEWMATSHSDDWVPELGMEYRFFGSFRTPDNEPHPVSSKPFSMDPS